MSIDAPINQSSAASLSLLYLVVNKMQLAIGRVCLEPMVLHSLGMVPYAMAAKSSLQIDEKRNIYPISSNTIDSIFWQWPYNCHIIYLVYRLDRIAIGTNLGQMARKIGSVQIDLVAKYLLAQIYHSVIHQMDFHH